jgi:hypothetical protein
MSPNESVEKPPYYDEELVFKSLSTSPQHDIRIDFFYNLSVKAHRKPGLSAIR